MFLYYLVTQNGPVLTFGIVKVGQVMCHISHKETQVAILKAVGHLGELCAHFLKEGHNFSERISA